MSHAENCVWWHKNKEYFLKKFFITCSIEIFFHVLSSFPSFFQRFSCVLYTYSLCRKLHCFYIFLIYSLFYHILAWSTFTKKEHNKKTYHKKLSSTKVKKKTVRRTPELKTWPKKKLHSRKLWKYKFRFFFHVCVSVSELIF